MNQQGTQIVNADYFNNLTKSVNATQSCDELQQLVAEAMASINAMKASIAAELAALQPLLALLKIPGANLGEIVGWIKNLVLGHLTPMLKPTISLAAQLAALEQQMSALLAAISAAQLRFPHCSVAIPAG